MPPVQIGEVMRGLSVGTIRASKSDKHPTGSYAAANAGWTELAALKREDVPAQQREAYGLFGCYRYDDIF